MITGLTNRFINSYTFFGTFSFTNQWGITKFNCLFTSDFFVLNETLFGEGFIALLFLLGFEIRGIGGMAFFTKKMKMNISKYRYYLSIFRNSLLYWLLKTMETI